MERRKIKLFLLLFLMALCGSSVFATTSVGSSDFNNTSYKLGIHWYGYSSTRKVLPMVSVGYTIKNFREKSLPSNRGMYLALGFRF